jgi:phosphate transport system substrate-binding protein
MMRIEAGHRTCLLALVLMVAGGSQAPAETLRVGGTGAALEQMRLVAQDFTRTRGDVTFDVPRSLGSTGGIKALIAGALQIALSARPLVPAERDAGLREIVYARTPLVFVTSKAAAEPGVTREQVLRIYDRRMTHWPDGARIHLVLRPPAETDVTIAAVALPGFAAAYERARGELFLPVAQTDQDNLELAERLAGSFALTALATVLAERRHVAVLALDGTVPSVAALEQGRYVFHKRLYLVTAEKPALRVTEFVAFLRSAAGAALLRRTGSLPQ